MPRFLASLLVVFFAVVTSSFGYGFYLLYATAVAAPREAKSEVPGSGLQAQLRQAEQALDAGKVEQALVAYRRILAAGPSLDAQLGLAEGERMAGREDVAAREYERALTLDPRNPTALLELGRIYAKRPDTWKVAEERYRDYLLVRKDDVDAQLGLARLLAWEQKWEPCTEILSRPGVQARMTFEDRRTHALALAASGRSSEAQVVLRALLATQPDDYDLRFQLAQAHAARQEWSTAVPLLRSLLATRPNDARAQYSYGLGLMAQGDARAALDPLSAAARALPEQRDVGLALARARKATGDLRGAAEAFARVLPRYDRDAGVVREYADLMMERQDYPKAERYYRAAMALGLRDLRLRVALAGALQANGKPKEAVPLLEEAYLEQPTDRLALDLARAYQRVGRNQDAMRLLKKLEEGK
jgi:predicted Zn-dependent protease